MKDQKHDMKRTAVLSRSRFIIPSFIIVLMVIVAGNSQSKSEITKAPFGTADGKSIDIYSIRNSKAVEVRITTFGGTVV